jgi:hypothetical protein
MIYDVRTYDLRPGDAARYLDLFTHTGLGLITRHLPLVGYFQAETGSLNRLVHVWRYADLADRAHRRQALYQDPDWLRDFVPRALPLLLSQHSVLCTGSARVDTVDVSQAPRPVLLMESGAPPAAIDVSSAAHAGVVVLDLQPLTGLRRWRRFVRLEHVAELQTLAQEHVTLPGDGRTAEWLWPCAFSPLR